MVLTAYASAEEKKIEADFTISVINDTDRIMCHNLFWLNHPFDHSGAAAVAGAELDPGEDHSWNWGKVGEKEIIFVIEWFPARIYSDNKDYRKYTNAYLINIPPNASGVKIFFNHFNYVMLLREN
jgi:hypothetical protein